LLLEQDELAGFFGMATFERNWEGIMESFGGLYSVKELKAKAGPEEPKHTSNTATKKRRSSECQSDHEDSNIYDSQQNQQIQEEAKAKAEVNSKP
jgi:hypothetical protein